MSILSKLLGRGGNKPLPDSGRQPSGEGTNQGSDVCTWAERIGIAPENDAWSVSFTLSTVPIECWFYHRNKLKPDSIKLELTITGDEQWSAKLARNDGLFSVQWRRNGDVRVDSSQLKYSKLTKWPILDSLSDFPSLAARIESLIGISFVRHANVGTNGWILPERLIREAGPKFREWLAPCADTIGAYLKSDSIGEEEDGSEIERTKHTVQLLVLADGAEDGATPETVFAGHPSAASGFEWPKCRSCGGNMQFLGQVRVDSDDKARLLLLFMCQNNPGGCSEWEADEGANAVISVRPEGLSLQTAPASGETSRTNRYAARVISVDSTDYDAARAEYAERERTSPRHVLGCLGGEPAWIQAEQTPSCDTCGQPMQFVAQLEEGPDAEAEMNFGGGGCAYVFVCKVDDASAKMLWQC